MKSVGHRKQERVWHQSFNWIGWWKQQPESYILLEMAPLLKKIPCVPTNWQLRRKHFQIPPPHKQGWELLTGARGPHNSCIHTFIEIVSPATIWEVQAKIHPYLSYTGYQADFSFILTVFNENSTLLLALWYINMLSKHSHIRLLSWVEGNVESWGIMVKCPDNKSLFVL